MPQMLHILNEDLSTLEGFEPFLKKSLQKNKEIPAGNILQIQHVLNISVAKQDGHGQQYDPERQILKITLTDGESTVYALVTGTLQRLNLNTPPGTKVKTMENIPAHGQLILAGRTNLQVLGGEVPKLIEKWNFQRSLDIKKDWGAFGSSGGGSDGPPLWRAFGKKSVPLDVALLRKMKAMDIVNEKKEAAGEESKTQFDQQRNETITELMETSVAKQKWQKPTKRLVEKEVQDIMDKGFSFEEASHALSKFKNEQKALRFLKNSRGEFEERSGPSEDRRDKRRKGRGKGDDEEDDAPIPREFQRPTQQISLFGFVADTVGMKGEEQTQPPPAFEAFEEERQESYGGRGGRGYSRGGRGSFESRGGGRGRGGRGRGNDRPFYDNSKTSYDTRYQTEEKPKARPISISNYNFPTPAKYESSVMEGRGGFSARGSSAKSGSDSRGRREYERLPDAFPRSSSGDAFNQYSSSNSQYQPSSYYNSNGYPSRGGQVQGESVGHWNNSFPSRGGGYSNGSNSNYDNGRSMTFTRSNRGGRGSQTSRDYY